MPMCVSEHMVRGKFRTDNFILPEANVKETFTLNLRKYALMEDRNTSLLLSISQY